MISYFIDHDVGQILYVELILIRNSNLLIFFRYLSSRNLAHGIVIKKKEKKRKQTKNFFENNLNILEIFTNNTMCNKFQIFKTFWLIFVREHI